jgi:hypothetical protein
MPEPSPENKKIFVPVIEQVEAPGGEPVPTSTPSPPPGATATPTSTPGTSQKVAIDPITRIEGHLRIEVQIEDGHVVDAWSAGMMFRGVELIMPGRDPRDAWVFTQRICGV